MGAVFGPVVFSVVLLILCGVVFVTSPAGLLDTLTPEWMNGTFWAIAYPIGLGIALILFIIYVIFFIRHLKKADTI
ncbi:MAG: hypothetical protein K6G64_01795 [Eubacterium sp.]|nr:hypothetical protein [Eubacterium sp.]